MSLIVSAPSAIATARSTSTRPGSRRGRGPRTHPVQRLAQLAGQRRGIREVGQQPRPGMRDNSGAAEVTTIFGRVVVACTSNCLSVRIDSAFSEMGATTRLAPLARTAARRLVLQLLDGELKADP
jgi:hypothetical protein